VNGAGPPAPLRRATLVRLWFGLFLLFACLAHGNLENTDALLTMTSARALYLRGDAGLHAEAQGDGWQTEYEIVDWIRNQHTYGLQGTSGSYYVWFPLGHVWLMLPCVAGGELLGRLWQNSDVEQQYRQKKTEPRYPYGMFVFDHALVCLLPAMFGAGSALLLLLLARAFGCGNRDALVATAAIALATQLFPLVRENLADGPGVCFLLAALLVVVRHHLGTVGPRALLLGGFAAGWAVLTRYQYSLMVGVLVLAVALTAWRRRRWSDVVAFGLGGLPCLVALCTVDWLRYGKITETGYGAANLAVWLDYPIWYGMPKLLIAAGKGILWFSPLLWLVLPLGLRRVHVPALRWLGWLLFALPMLMFSATDGWQSGQCWGDRYVTPGVVGLLAIVLPQARPWRSWPKTFWLLFVLGLLVNVTGVVAPTRGYGQLAAQGAEAWYRLALQRGEITRADLDGLDHADHYFFLPRFSPLHANWTYAFLSCSGRFEDAAGQRQDGAANTIVPMFGVDPAGIEPIAGRKIATVTEMGLGPIHWEDRGFRHLWFRFWGELLAVPAWLLLLPVAAMALLLLLPPLRRLSRD